MPYSATWTNADAQGRLTAGEHYVSLVDPREIADAINRRRLLTYQGEHDFSGHVHSGGRVRRRTFVSSTPADNLRESITHELLHPPLGSLGGSPPTPSGMDWLWPEADADENKKIITATPPGAGEVNFYDKLNGTTGWTDSEILPGQTYVRAVHFNELRDAVEMLRRGRWQMPIYFVAGIFSAVPGVPWAGNMLANDGSDEVRSVGYCMLKLDDGRGLSNAAARSSSTITITVDTACSVAIYRCKRPMNFVSNPPTWQQYQPPATWASPGGLGDGDAEYIGSIGLSAYTPGSVSGSGVAAAVQAMAGGAEQNFILRRSDNGPETITIYSATLTAEFDIISPPN